MSKFYFGGSMEILGAGDIGTLTLDDNFVDGISNYHIPLSNSEEVRFECDVNSSVFLPMIGGVDLSNREDITSYTLSGKFPRRVQARHHKKKRIDKKWAKRYGYKIVYENVCVTDIRFNRDDSSFEGIIGAENVCVPRL